MLKKIKEIVSENKVEIFVSIAAGLLVGAGFVLGYNSYHPAIPDDLVIKARVEDNVLTGIIINGRVYEKVV